MKTVNYENNRFRCIGAFLYPFNNNLFKSEGDNTMHKTFKLALAAGALAFAASSGASAGGASAAMLSDTCAGCHGTDGASGGPAMPTIAGMSNDFFIEVMQGYASGDLPSTIMGRIAKGYSEGEIKAMAKHYSGLKFTPAKQKHDAKLAQKGAKLHDKYCEKCHAEGGSSAEDDAGILKGQWAPYVKWTLADYIDGSRTASKKMKKKLSKMVKKEGDKGIEALLNFYASGQ